MTTFKYSLEVQETERLMFRRLELTDFDTWLKFCESDDAVRYLNFLSKIKEPQARCKAWFERVFHRYENGLGGMNALIDKNTNEFVGQCGLIIHEIDGDDELEVGYSILPEHYGKGYATEAARKCKEFAFQQGYATSIISLIDANNTASANVALKNGMKLERAVMFNAEPINLYRVHKTTVKQ